MCPCKWLRTALIFCFLQYSSCYPPRYHGIEFYCSIKSKSANFTDDESNHDFLEDITHLATSLHHEYALVKIRTIAQSIATDDGGYHVVTLTIDRELISTAEIEPESINVYVNYAAWNNWYLRTFKISDDGSRLCCRIAIEGISPGAARLGISVENFNLKDHDQNKSEATVSTFGYIMYVTPS